MFKRAGSPLASHLRRLQRQVSSSSHGIHRNGRILPGIAISAGALTAYSLWSSAHIHNDSASSELPGKVKQEQVPLIPGGDVGETKELRTAVWGSNRSNTLIPGDIEVIRRPSVAEWLDGVALRDLVLHEEHAACVDARGDVYQWGTKFQGETQFKPALTLRGKNVKQLKLTEGRIYALSSSGKVYVLSAEATKQDLQPGRPTPSSDGWWGTGWFWGEDETVDFIELIPKERLGWKEKFVSIDAGDDHLLALTSQGRVFAHPINKRANTHGQLGFSKFQIPDPSALHRPNVSTRLLDVELIPKTTADPFLNFSRNQRPVPARTISENLLRVDDQHVRFCVHLFEIPVLKGIEISQIAAGARSSFARTAGGRVLSWGANNYGQLGLGNDLVLDTVTVPTEVVLWRTPATQETAKCLDVSAGGDLTAFTVMNLDQSPVKVDLRMCGNGQSGGLGTTTLTSAQPSPQPAKNISGLVEYNDVTRSLQPITPRTVTISPTGHVLVSMNTGATSNVGGRDLFLWGRNYESEMGNGKKSSVLLPATMETPEGGRFMLRTRKADVKDLHGRIWGRGVLVEQQATAGYQSSCVYWRIVQ